MSLYFVFVPIAFVMGWELARFVERLPLCTCGDTDCGGDCIDWGNQ